jgi:Ulp1 family protease
LEALIRWFDEYRGVKFDPPFDVSIPKDIPLQTNGNDCGVFMLTYADYVARDADMIFDDKMVLQRKFFCLSILRKRWFK